jgi:hypothetical protein
VLTEKSLLSLIAIAIDTQMSLEIPSETDTAVLCVGNEGPHNKLIEMINFGAAGVEKGNAFSAYRG